VDPSALRAALPAKMPLVNDHPDVAGLLRDPAMLADLGPALAAPFVRSNITAVVAPEARGPIVGALVAVSLGVGLILARKEGQNHPGANLSIDSDPTWRGHPQRFIARSFDLDRVDGDHTGYGSHTEYGSHRVLIVDDWITTGSSIRAVRDLICDAGATYVGASVIVNKATPATLTTLKASTLVDFDAIMSSSTFGTPKESDPNE